MQVILECDNFDIKEYFRNLSIECFAYDINYNKTLLFLI